MHPEDVIVDKVVVFIQVILIRQSFLEPLSTMVLNASIIMLHLSTFQLDISNISVFLKALVTVTERPFNVLEGTQLTILSAASSTLMTL